MLIPRFLILQLLALWSNPGENVLTPFMGVGSEVYAAVMNGRRGIGIELKVSLEMFDYDQAATIVIAIFLLVLAVERASTWVRNRIL